jgi:hypothetical protein
MEYFLEYSVTGLVISATLYMILHMTYNRIRGRDEIEGIFRIRFKKKEKDSHDS